MLLFSLSIFSDQWSLKIENENKITACGCQCLAVAALENAKLKRGITLSKNWRIISPTDMGSPFDSEQLL